MELQQSGDAECSSLCAAQRIKQQLSAQRAFPLLGPDVNFLLAISKRTVLPVLALLTLLHLYRTPRRGTVGMYRGIGNSSTISCCFLTLKYSRQNVNIPLQSTKAPKKLFRAGRGRILFQVGSSMFLRRHSRTSLLHRCAASG